MSQSNPQNNAASSNANLLPSSSTPIRISGTGSFHGSHNQSVQQELDSSPSLGGSALQHSSSVPTSGAAHQHHPGHLQLQGTPSSQMAASNQSLGGAAGGGGGGSSSTPPNSAGLRQTVENKLIRRTSLQILLPKLPSTDSLSNSPGPSSPGIANWATDNRDKYDGNQTDKTPTDTSKLNRKESYKAQRKNYRREKKRVASELLNSLQDPAVIVLADWLKVRGTLKSWTKLWCVLKPGLLLIYKSPKTKSSHWVGTVLITSCQVIERPSKKDGFCFKLFHPMEQSIWAPRGPDKETIGAVVQPLPTAYLIFRAPSQAAGKCWMDALELSLRCSALLLRSSSNSGAVQSSAANIIDVSGQISHETQWSEADYERHFNEHDLDVDSQNEGAAAVLSGPESDSDSDGVDIEELLKDEPETPYVPLIEEEFGEQIGEQVEELGEENKSLIWCLVKQVRPGMDLSKVVLPTFILEPRSFLDKLSDSYFHADILSQAVAVDDPFTRMKLVVKWYLSGFYKKPKGLKKPYNPILGETFRCYWQHPNGSRTFYIAEQVSHHPPVSAFYVTNRQDGFCISCSILAKSKFYGNSTSAVLEGVAKLTLLPRGECYTLTTPYAHCKGILMGTLSMELGGKINIECENTGYKTEIEFKLKPFLGGSEGTNVVAGKIRLGKETLATINGRWDSDMRIKDSKTSEETVLFKVTTEMKQKRLTRFVVPIEAQLEKESERLWQHVSAAILRDDQIGATEEKTVLEEKQRLSAKERQSLDMEWFAEHFQLDLLTGDWIYKYADLRPWDPRNDVKQYESNYRVLTKTRHQAPMVRTNSIIGGSTLRVLHNQSTGKGASVSSKRRKGTLLVASDSSDDNETSLAKISSKDIRKLAAAIEQVNKALDEHKRQLVLIHTKLERMQYAPSSSYSSSYTSVSSGSSLFIFDLLPQTIPQSTAIKWVSYAMLAILLSVLIKWWSNK